MDWFGDYYYLACVTSCGKPKQWTRNARAALWWWEVLEPCFDASVGIYRTCTCTCKLSATICTYKLATCSMLKSKNMANWWLHLLQRLLLSFEGKHHLPSSFMRPQPQSVRGLSSPGHRASKPCAYSCRKLPQRETPTDALTYPIPPYHQHIQVRLPARAQMA